MSDQQPEQISIPIAMRMQSNVSDDGNYVGLHFETRKGVIDVALPAQDLGDMIARLISISEDIAAEHATKIAETETVTAYPIQVAALGVGQGRTENEAMLSIRSGPLSLMFAVELSILSDTCRNLEQATRRREPRKPH